MNTINRQLGIGVAPSPLTPTRYARGLKTSQPQLGTEDWSLDFYNDTQSIDDMSNANGDDSWNNAVGLYGIAYPICVTRKCRFCKTKCQGEGKRWLSGGKACYNSCVATFIEGKLDAKGKPIPSSISTLPTSTDTQPTPTGQDENPIIVEQKAGLSTGAMVGIVVGGIAVIGLIGYLVLRKK